MDNNKFKVEFKKMILEVFAELQFVDRPMTKDEAADFLKVSTHAINRLAFKEKQISYSKSGRNAVFFKSDLLKYLANRRIPSIFEEGV